MRLLKISALTFAAAITLTSCATDQTTPDTQSTTSSENSMPSTAESPSETPKDDDTKASTEETLTFVDQSFFEVNPGIYVVGAEGVSSLCMIHDVNPTPGCQVHSLVEPLPPVNFDYDLPDITEVNSLIFNEVKGFDTGYMPGAQGFPTVPKLKPGEMTELHGTTFTLSPDGKFTVRHGAHWYSVKDSVYSSSTPEGLSANPTFAGDTALTGQVCGQIPSVTPDDPPMNVVALEDNTDCKVAMSVMRDYRSDNPSGTPPVGNGYLWNAPNGWGCSRGFALNYGAPHSDYWPSCSAKSTDGVPASEGVGRVAAITVGAE
ncbi:hypothetical protein [Corynebacterium renale]|uniref:hypothetical protein n=1 Tax=Corynebacterium renale TaxID=1724 RepID=UPI0011AB6E45|nr:hypothetical protein [Corynebacterium renale]